MYLCTSMITTTFNRYWWPLATHAASGGLSIIYPRYFPCRIRISLDNILGGCCGLRLNVVLERRKQKWRTPWEGTYRSKPHPASVRPSFPIQFYISRCVVFEVSGYNTMSLFLWLEKKLHQERCEPVYGPYQLEELDSPMPKLRTKVRYCQELSVSSLYPDFDPGCQHQTLDREIQ